MELTKKLQVLKIFFPKNLKIIKVKENIHSYFIGFLIFLKFDKKKFLILFLHFQLQPLIFNSDNLRYVKIFGMEKFLM